MTKKGHAADDVDAYCTLLKSHVKVAFQTKWIALELFIADRTSVASAPS